ncbi:unnamed protein product [Camellia sinensis]
MLISFPPVEVISHVKIQYSMLLVMIYCCVIGVGTEGLCVQDLDLIDMDGGSSSAVGIGAHSIPARRSNAIYQFTQQSLPACKPVLTPAWVVEIVDRYDTDCVPEPFTSNKVAYIKDSSIPKNCSRFLKEKMLRFFIFSKELPVVLKAFVHGDGNLFNNYPELEEALVWVYFHSNIPEYNKVECWGPLKNAAAPSKIPKYMKAPIYIYYQLDNYYQNHRRYVKSRSDHQLLYGLKYNDTGSCKPEESNSGLPIVPCGLIAWSLFNDTYSFSRGTEELKVNRKNIAWKSDRDHKFGKQVYPFNFQNGTLIGGANLDPNIPTFTEEARMASPGNILIHSWPNCNFLPGNLDQFPSLVFHVMLHVSLKNLMWLSFPASPLSDQEDLIVWMRTAALPSFRKLYGKIEEDLDVDDVVVVNLLNNYNTYSFGGKKKLVLSTSSWLGGKNHFLGMAYLSVGSSSILISLVFLLLHVKNPRFKDRKNGSILPTTSLTGTQLIYLGTGKAFLVEVTSLPTIFGLAEESLFTN